MWGFSCTVHKQASMLLVSRGSRGHVRESERARLMQANMCTIPFMVIGAALLLKAHFQTHVPSLVKLNCECRRYYEVRECTTTACDH
jgi:hypothetical protein